MATVRTAFTRWTGNLLTGRGVVSLDSSGADTYEVTWPARAEQRDGVTSPEELIAAAHSSCYSMAFSHEATERGYTVARVKTAAEVTFEPGEGITRIFLAVTACVPGLSESDFAVLAEQVKQNCPVSQALAGVKNITLEARLLDH